MEKPKVVDILELWSNTRTYYGTMMAELATKRDYVNGNYKIEIPEEIRGYTYKSPKPFVKVHKGSVQLVTEYPRFSLPTGYEADQRNAIDNELILKFCNQLFKEAEKQNDIPPLRSVAYDMLQYGTTDLELHWMEGEYKAGRWPFYMKAVNAETVYMLPDGSYFKYYTRRISEVMEHLKKLNYGKSKPVVQWDESKKQNDDTVEWLEYRIPGEWRMVFVDEDPIFVDEVQKDEEVTFLSQKYSGWAGTTPDGKPEDLAVGINDHTFDLVKFESVLTTTLAAGVAKNILPTPKVLASQADMIEYPEYVGDKLTLPHMGALEYEPPPPVNQDAYQMLNLVRTDVDNMTFNPALQGRNQANVQSGTHAAVLTGQDMKTFRPVRKALELMVQEVLIAGLKMIEKFADKGIKINSTDTIRKSNLKFPLPIMVDLEPQDPEREEAKNMALLKFWVSGAIPWVVFAHRSNLLEDVGVESARRMMLVEMALNHPQVQMMMAEKALQEWALKEEGEAIEQAGKELGTQGQTGETFGTRDGRALGQAQNMLNQTAAGGGMEEVQGVVQQ